MAKVEVYDWNKKKTGEVDLSDKILTQELRKDVLHSVVRWQLARRRKGTHDTKNRGDVSGGGKKPYKQKGTGNARQGSSRSPLLEGGSMIHGPHPRNYDFNLNKKTKQLGLRTALSYLYKEGRFFVVEEMTSKDGKTKELASRLENFGLSKALMIDEKADDKFQRASNNLEKFRYNTVEGMNVYDLLKYDAVILSKASLEKVTQKCGVQ